MALETKAAVAIDQISAEEANGIFQCFGFQSVVMPVRIYGGMSSSNFKVVGKRNGEGDAVSYLLKINYYGLSREDIEYQLFVMNHLRTNGFPTNYPHEAKDGSYLLEKDGRLALLLDFFVGIPGSDILAKQEAKAPRLLSDLSTTLARLHQVVWPEDRVLRNIRSGFPVCNTGDILRGEEIQQLQADERFAGHPFLSFVSDRVSWFRELYDRKVPWGFIHGDAFLDNTLYEDGPPDSGECRLLALFDWEDSCIGPFVLDLAVCASAACFTASNELVETRLRILLDAYLKQRPFSDLEATSFVNFMAAGAIACAYYRFMEFNVRQPESPQEAKKSYELLYNRAKLLLDGLVREAIQSMLQGVLHPR